MGYLHSQSTHPHVPLLRSPGPHRCAQLCWPPFHHLFPAVESKILPYLFLHYFLFLYGKQLPQPFLCAVITFLVPMYLLSSPHLLASFQYFDPLLSHSIFLFPTISVPKLHSQSQAEGYNSSVSCSISYATGESS